VSSLFEAARLDGPSAGARAKIWGGVASGAGLAASAIAASVPAAAPSGASVAGASVAPAAAAGAGKILATKMLATKMLAIGALLGSAATVGVAAFVLSIAQARLPVDSAGSAAAVDLASRSGAERAAEAPVVVHASSEVAERGQARLAAPPTRRPDSPPARSIDDAFARESLLVAEARGALVRDDADGALKAVRAARATGARQLEPEELAIEAQALRHLGAFAEAARVEAQLRARFPEHALSR
jgi:hypothetical protein